MSITIIGLVIGISTVGFFLIGSGRRFWWFLLLAILFAPLGIKGDAIFKNGKQSMFESLPISPIAQAETINILGLIGAGAACAFILRLALSLVARRPSEKQ